MPTPRTRSVSTKVTDEEYVLFESLAGGQTISEWAREVLLKAAKPSTAEQTIVAELLALRMILLNALFTIARQEPLTREAMDDVIKRADAGKSVKALARLTQSTTEPQGS